MWFQAASSVVSPSLSPTHSQHTATDDAWPLQTSEEGRKGVREERERDRERERERERERGGSHNQQIIFKNCIMHPLS